MNSVLEIITDFEKNVGKLVDKNKKSLILIEELRRELNNKEVELLEIKEKYNRESLKKSEEQINETKISIDKLVEDIDACISLMEEN